MNRGEFLQKSAVSAAALSIPLDLRVMAASQNQTYTMTTFVSELDYWKDCFRGMQDAADFLAVSVKYVGAPDNNLVSEVQVFNDVVAARPDGILLTAINPDGIKPAIDAAI